MTHTLSRYYDEQKNRVVEKCKECGKCAKKCPIIQHIEFGNASPQDIQKKIKAYLETGEANETVLNRAFSCMQCFQCVDKCCPEGLNPLLVNELIKWEYRQKKIAENTYEDPKDYASTHRVLASLQLSAEAYRKISTASPKDTVTYVFFSGCNVYFQPEKLLTALDILELITDDYAFVPGLDYCCGNAHLFGGDLDKTQERSTELIGKLTAYRPETVIFWCPTCLCRFHTTLLKVNDVPFNMISFPQFLARHMKALAIKNRIAKTVTLHEACKSAFTGLDLTGARDVLKQLPGLKLIEMPRHGKDTVCCGSGAQHFFPNSFETVRDDRLAEAAQTKAEVLVDVCHHCHNVFCRHESEYGIEVKNYVSLVAEALGIERKDKFKTYKQWTNLDRILSDAHECIQASPYSRDKIIEVIKNTLIL